MVDISHPFRRKTDRFIRRGSSTALLEHRAPGNAGDAVIPAPEENGELEPAVTLLTGPGGPLDIPDNLRRDCVIFSDGTFLVSRASITNAAILSLADKALALKPPVRTKPIEIADLTTIRRAYGSSATRAVANAQGIKARLLALLDEAASLRANDVQIALRDDLATVHFQIDGFLTDTVEEFHGDEVDALATSAFYYGDNGDPTPNPNVNQRVTVTDRRKLPAGVFAFRMHFAPLAQGRHLNIRIIYADLPIKGEGLTPLGLPDELVRVLLYIQQIGRGLFTIGAPTEHGKSATQTIWLGDLMTRRKNRMTCVSIDDPPEGIDTRFLYYPVTGETTQTGEDSFLAALKACLRVAPHVIRVSECRDSKPAIICFEAANTGKPVVTTIHCDCCLDIPSRWVELGVPKRIAYSVSRYMCWWSQRLVPTLCQSCRVTLPTAAATDPVASVLYERFSAAIGADADRIHVKGPGCPECSGHRTSAYPGIKGRRLIAEYCLPDRKLCEMLADDQVDKARQYWISKMGCKSMALWGYDLLLTGIIGAEEWLQFVGTAEQLAGDRAALEARTPELERISV